MFFCSSGIPSSDIQLLSVHIYIQFLQNFVSSLLVCAYVLHLFIIWKIVSSSLIHRKRDQKENVYLYLLLLFFTFLSQQKQSNRKIYLNMYFHFHFYRISILYFHLFFSIQSCPLNLYPLFTTLICVCVLCVCESVSLFSLIQHCILVFIIFVCFLCLQQQ